MNERAKYSDIIGLPRHVSEKHERMETRDRAKLFAPFSALSGYEEAVRARCAHVALRPELNGDAKEALDAALQMISRALRNGRRPRVSVVLFSAASGKRETISGKAGLPDGGERVITVGDVTVNLDDVLEVTVTKI